MMPYTNLNFNLVLILPHYVSILREVEHKGYNYSDQITFDSKKAYKNPSSLVDKNNVHCHVFYLDFKVNIYPVCVCLLITNTLCIQI